MTLQNNHNDINHNDRPIHSHPTSPDRAPVQDAAEFIKQKITDTKDEELDWSDSVIMMLLYPFTQVAPLLFLLGLIGYFLWKAFEANLSVGVRSFAAVMIPLIVLTVAYTAMNRPNQKEKPHGFFSRIPPWVTFSTLALIAAGVLAVIPTFHTAIPVPEFVLSATFSLLLFSRTLPPKQMISYYFGAVIGFLVYIVLFGIQLNAS